MVFQVVILSNYNLHVRSLLSRNS